MSSRWSSSFAALALVVSVAVPALAVPTTTDDVSVLVIEAVPSSADAEALVERLGGTVGLELGLVGGFSATVPSDAVDALAADPAVASVSPNERLALSTAGWDDASKIKNYNPNTYEGSVFRIATGIVQVADYWTKGYTGAGVDVALIDSGVVGVPGLTQPGKVLNGPDLSFESQSDKFRHLDTFGHGTHMAGIIAGRDNNAAISSTNSSEFLGVAPGARIVNVKVADRNGATDVSQVIAAIDWVVQNRNKHGLNIRVLNLSFGTDSSQSYLVDPLAFAVEQAWKAGIVVVVAAGNDGNSSALRNPATDPFVIAVGSTTSGKTRPGVSDVAPFSNCGTAARSVDVVVPGQSVVSLRNPGSTADTNFPNATISGRYFLGSGTSQSAAVVSGLAALLVQERPQASPDQVKKLLMLGSTSISKASALCQGAGLPDMSRTQRETTPLFTQTFLPSSGLGSLDASRGSERLETDGVILDGERDIFGVTWDGTSWSTAAAMGTSWSGGDWNGTSWSGTSWSGTSWSGTSWSGTSWSGTSWSGTSWSGTSWSDMAWSGTSWSGTSWSGTSWSGTSWSSKAWLGQSWG